jgi:hypothetical protein
MLDATEARRSRLRLDLLMTQIDVLYQEIVKLERECPAPRLEDFEEMETGTQPYRYEVFFLGLLGEIEVSLNEAIRRSGRDISATTSPTSAGIFAATRG